MSSLSSWTAKRPQRASFTANCQQPPIPKSLREGIICTTLSSAKESIICEVLSVEWLSTTSTLNGKAAFCLSTDDIASAMVDSRLRTGITTEASTGNSPAERSIPSYLQGGNQAPTSFR